MHRRLLLNITIGTIGLIGLNLAGCSDDTITHYNTPMPTEGTPIEIQNDTPAGFGDDIDDLVTNIGYPDTTTGILDKGETDNSGNSTKPGSGDGRGDAL